MNIGVLCAPCGEVFPVQLVLGWAGGDGGLCLPPGPVPVCGVQSISGLLPSGPIRSRVMQAAFPRGPRPVGLPWERGCSPRCERGPVCMGRSSSRLLPAWPLPVGSCARPRHEGLVGAGSRVGSPLGHRDGSVSSSASPGAPIHGKESHAFPLEIRIEPNCAAGQSPASSAGPARPGKGSQMVLA